jgi:hypothetical protein
MNSPRLLTFSTLVRGIDEGWNRWLASSTRTDVALVIDQALRMAREEVPEWGPLPFAKRRAEREHYLYSQAIVQRAMLRVFADWHQQNESVGAAGDWERWRPVLRRVKTPYEYRGFVGEFLSRSNPRFFEQGAGVYQLNKGARHRRELAERQGLPFELDPVEDLTVQNTQQSLEFMYGELKQFFAYEPRQLALQELENR